MDRHLIFGPPGTGKTTRLLGLLNRELLSGVPPERIAFVSFTRKAAQEAAQRACTAFRLDPRRFPYFRTIHSLCFQELGLTKEQVLSPKHLKELEEILGVPFTPDPEELAGGLRGGSKLGDKALRIATLAALTQRSIQDVWHELQGVDVIDWYQLEWIVDSYNKFKEARGLLDFTDMLIMFRDGAYQLPVDVSVVDEAQDLSGLQWDIVEAAFGGCQRQFVAGDDDQTIFTWAGADVERFLTLEGSREVLGQSHRLNLPVYAVAHRIAQRIAHRESKLWVPRDAPGVVERVTDFDYVLPQMNTGTWMVLVRNVHQLPRFVNAVRQAGYLYTSRGATSVSELHLAAIRLWERGLNGGELSEDELAVLSEYVDDMDADTHWWEAFTKLPAATREYYRSCLRNGEDVHALPRVLIDTIHSVKGGEADNVVVLPDWTPRIDKEFAVNPDAEHRVWYVAVTRARNRLYLLTPQSNLHYQFPTDGI